VALTAALSHTPCKLDVEICAAKLEELEVLARQPPVVVGPETLAASTSARTMSGICDVGSSFLFSRFWCPSQDLLSANVDGGVTEHAQSTIADRPERNVAKYSPRYVLERVVEVLDAYPSEHKARRSCSHVGANEPRFFIADVNRDEVTNDGRIGCFGELAWNDVASENPRRRQYASRVSKERDECAGGGIPLEEGTDRQVELFAVVGFKSG
jgi:hypothetical protein